MAHTTRKSLLIAAFTLAITGCTTTPTAPPAVELPPATLTDVHLDRWWTNFNKPPLTALIDEALANNLDLQVARARIDAARAQVTLARGSLYPTVDVGVNAGRSLIVMCWAGAACMNSCSAMVAAMTSWPETVTVVCNKAWCRR